MLKFEGSVAVCVVNTIPESTVSGVLYEALINLSLLLLIHISNVHYINHTAHGISSMYTIYTYIKHC